MKIQILDEEVFKYPFAKITKLCGRIYPRIDPVFGIDPGYGKAGLAYCHKNTFHAFQVQYQPTKDIVERLLKIRNTVDVVFSCLDLEKSTLEKIRGVVESSSFSSKGVQASLGEARGVFIITLHAYIYDVHVMPPKSIRKIAFGSGKTTGEELYPDLPGDACAAIGCAIAASKLP